MRKHQSKRLTALLLALVLCLGLAVPAGAASTGSNGVKIEKVDNSAVSVSLTDDSQQTTLTEEETPLYQDTDMVRVSIVLKGKSTLEKGFSTQHIAANSQAMAYRSGLQAQQETLTKKISKDALGGKTLDVVWNLTLAANIISANVAYGDIDAIKAVSGVEDVVLETRYEPQVASVDALDPNMATSGSMIGSDIAYLEGYNGAGTRIAVIDTGTDTDHQSFNADAFEYAINEDIEDGKNVSLMTAKDIEKVLDQLNIAGNEGVTADSLYLNAKLPFAYNYVDGDFDVTHDHDSQSEHGSHVAGIATANRYIKTGEDTYSDALDVAHMKGVAPDAQLITMKVFGKGGGAYDSDYMAAIEDAIVLDCDSVNLSLGSAMGGMSFTSTYQDLLNKLTESDTVVSISSGNAGYWAENAATGGYLYADDVNFQTDGAPGSYTNVLTVASADNIGSTGTPLLFGENKVFYTEPAAGNEPITTLDKSGSGTEYDFIYTTGIGSAEQLKALQDAGVDFTGKVVLVSRGTTTFSDKHQSVAAVGGAACIVVNNAAGEINMDLSASKATIPCVSIPLADGQTIQAQADAVKDADGNTLYYTGKVTISSKVSSGYNANKNYSMSSFSSWGVPGSLQLKPEITAPGGNIYSVNGADKSGTAYENMSGTSMAAPQVTGMAALAAQYLKESNVKADGLTTRALVQSLLMSTAVPLKTEDGTYYPVIQQGAGLANVGAVINAHSYITMDADATSGAADGKVKVELGDDPTKTGVYTFGFTLHDLGQGGTYALSGDVFTQALFNEGGIDYLDTATAALEGAKVSFDQDSVTLGAGKSVHVKATIDVTGCDALKNYPNGTYIQAFITVAEQSTEEGVTGTTHTIPVLGFYGGWTDASMYDVGNWAERKLRQEKRGTYLANDEINAVGYTFDGEVYQREFGPNRYRNSEQYIEDRNSLNNQSGEKLIGIVSAEIRNAGGAILQVTDAATGKVYVRHELGSRMAAYYYTNQSKWQNAGDLKWFQWAGTDQAGNALPEGTKVNYQLVMAPEYYASADGSYDWDALTDGDLSNGELGQGAYLGTTLTIDNTAPEILSAELDGSTLTVVAKDQRYIACIALTNGGGTTIIKKSCPNQKTADTEYTWTADMSKTYGKNFLLSVYDYAGNQSTYSITLEEAFNGADIDGALVGVTSGKAWYTMKNGTASKLEDAASTYYGAAYVGGKVFLTGESGSALYVADVESLSQLTRIASLGGVVTALAYDCNAEKLYGISLDENGENAQLLEISMTSGAVTKLGEPGVSTTTLATDSKGNFYSIEFGTGDLYTFTLDTMDAPTLVGSTGYLNNYVQGLTYNNNDGQLYWAQYFAPTRPVSCDINGDGKTDSADAQLIVDYVSGKLTEEEKTEKNYNFSDADVNGDGRVDTFDAHLLLNLNVVRGEMAYLLRVDMEDASTQVAATLPTEVAALFAPDDTKLPAALTQTSVESVVISQDSLSLTPSVSTQLTAYAAPWTLADTAITWTSSDEDVATVDATGLVTAKSVGTATITATSVADPSISADCEVTVTAVDVTITGALQDADRNAQFFTWNLGEDSTWTPGAALENSVEAVTNAPNGNFWQMDAYDYNMHLVSADGTTLETYKGIGNPLADMGASAIYSTDAKPLIYGAYQYYLYFLQDPTALTPEYMNMMMYLMLMAQAGEFVAITSAVPSIVVDGDVEHVAETVYMMDNCGQIWSASFYQENGQMMGSFKITKTDSLYFLKYSGEGANKNCSMVRADNGDFFFSYYDGRGNVLYRLTPNAEAGIYDSTIIADFGEGVRPASLLSATYNDTETADASANVISAADALFSGTVEELNAQSEAFAAQLDSTLTSFNANAGSSASTSAGTLSVTPGQGDSKTVTLDLNAENSTNGKLTVGYDTDVLTLTAVEPTDAALNSFVTAEDGTVTFAYANKTAVNGKLATLTFSYDASSAPKTTVATVTTLEEGGSQKEIAQKVTLTLKDEVVVPVGPSEPSKPSTPTEPEKPDFPFKDVTEDHPFYEDIKYVYEKGLMQGVSEDIFQSGTTTTRGMIATILYRMEGEPAVKNASSFKDVADGMFYTKAVAWAAANGIVNGYADGTFQPDQTISREQMAAILYRYAQYKGCDVSVGEDTNILSYSDATQVAEYAIPAFQWAVGAGIINGTTATTLSPKGSATRGQVAAILHRYCEWIG